MGASHKFQPRTVPTAVAVAFAIAFALLALRGAVPAAANVHVTLGENGPSEAPDSLGVPVANEINLLAGLVGLLPPNAQSSICCSTVGWNGIHQASVTIRPPADTNSVSPGNTVRAVSNVPYHHILPELTLIVS